ncbi:hypothetical protein [Komagataeibacter sp. SM21]|uniref:hypothetical protein n=1 Tax=Komagataeibacter sp. SM21 TaxID=3242899 RepID=UPI003526FF90
MQHSLIHHLPITMGMGTGRTVHAHDAPVAPLQQALGRRTTLPWSRMPARTHTAMPAPRLRR